ncbi:hypothetical protein TWF730_010852 [Orbilia blumenaviensis]|uniref:Hepatocellular carcinoma-associated antigen 59-domain-containing protein n=1 Tax=Orbilia blumenaviensis TaxID=1796055 RepID=A0AAV9UIQ6_9PEZI
MELDTPQPPSDPFTHTFKARKNRPGRQIRNRDEEKSTPAGDVKGSGTPQPTEGDNKDVEAATEPPKEDAMEEDESSMSVAEILRLRKQAKSKKGGLDFTVDRRAKTPTAEEEEAMAEKDAVDKEVNAVVNRFTGQTGAIVDVNEHMMKYIESELAKRRMTDASLPIPMSDDDSDTETKRVYPAPLTSTKISERRIGKWPIRPDFRGATLGKLQEIDLGAESTRKNVERTEEAKRRIEAGEAFREPEPEDPKKKKRGKRRRNSMDIERDKLVEEVLKESRLDIYEEPDPATTKTQAEEDEYAADDRIAEQFRREFMDALIARRRGKSNHNKKKDDPKRPRGPKLGGSRAARAAMRESERAAGKR